MADHGQESDQADNHDQAEEEFHDGHDPMEAGGEALTTTHTGRSRVIDNRIPPRLRYSHRSDEIPGKHRLELNPGDPDETPCQWLQLESVLPFGLGRRAQGLRL